MASESDYQQVVAHLAIVEELLDEMCRVLKLARKDLLPCITNLVRESEILQAELQKLKEGDK